jgi:hypothetical protein
MAAVAFTRVVGRDNEVTREAVRRVEENMLDDMIDVDMNKKAGESRVELLQSQGWYGVSDELLARTGSRSKVLVCVIVAVKTSGLPVGRTDLTSYM